jgi:hypothetical protein
MDQEELESFFGRQLRGRHVWSPQDGEWGRSMVEHYKKNGVHDHDHDHDHSAGQGTTATTIPRILHMIWLGPRPLPTTMTTTLESWRHYHSDWEIHVWREQDINFDLYNQDAFSYAMQHSHYGMASDILRLEILQKYGGVYVDVDYLCISSLNELEQHFDFYCGASHTGCIEVNNGLFGARANNVVVRRFMKEINTWFRQDARPLLLVSSFIGEDTSTTCCSLLTDLDICRHTGPGLWTRVLGQHLMDHHSPLSETFMIFPFDVFHPMPNTDRHADLTHEQVIHKYATENTRAIHLWYCSWQKPKNDAVSLAIIL